MEKLNTQGYDMIELEGGIWSFGIRHGVPIYGTFRDVVIVMIHIGFKYDDIDYAVSEMCKKGHNGIHFGAYKTMIFSFDTNEEKKSA